ncbi:MAG: CarD family transcriptional regulator [Anaerolineaceae bacterium]|jgi:RNA polymerase-interacting CarD/CdnL/TRCF family regulator|nr:CarD family transcriptional regulator [Anaerolineaceae bacterium]
MNDNSEKLKNGDWIVHVAYGVGQIDGIEPMPLSENEEPCYRVRTQDSTFWLPMENMDSHRVRPLASPEGIQRALQTLRQPPNKMASGYKARRQRIQDVIRDGDLKTDMILVRDLNELQFNKGLNDTEQRAYNTIVRRFLQEWTLSKDIQMKEAKKKLNQFLQESRKKGKQKQVAA